MAATNLQWGQRCWEFVFVCLVCHFVSLIATIQYWKVALSSYSIHVHVWQNHFEISFLEYCSSLTFLTFFSFFFYRWWQDSTVKIWDTVLGQVVKTLSSHIKSVTCVKWGGEGLIYTSSQDRTIKVWRAEDVSLTEHYLILDSDTMDLSKRCVISYCTCCRFVMTIV